MAIPAMLTPHYLPLDERQSMRYAVCKPWLFFWTAPLAIPAWLSHEAAKPHRNS